MEDYILRARRLAEHLIGTEVNYVRFSYQIDFSFISSQEPWRYSSLQCEALSLGDGTSTQEVDPMNPEPAHVLKLVALLHQEVTACELISSDVLRIAFESGNTITLNPRLIDKAWTIDLPPEESQ